MKYSYNYEELLEEIKGDIDEGLIGKNESIRIEREKSLSGYKPIIDYFFKEDKVEGVYEVVNVQDVIKEMEKYNKII